MAGGVVPRGPSLRDASAPSGVIKVLIKAGAVLDVFLEARTELRIDEIARRLQLSKTTTYRLVQSMERIGLLERDQNTRAFRLGVKVLRLGAAAGEQMDIRRVARPVLTDLTAATSQTAFLTLLRDRVGVCVERVAGAHVEILPLKIGGVLPLYCGAGPRVLLAGLPDESIRSYLAETTLRPFTANTIATADDLWRDIARTRAQKYVLSDEDVTPGVCAVGAPVLDAAGQVAAAVLIAALKVDYRPEMLRRLVATTREAAETLSDRLGAPTGDLRA